MAPIIRSAREGREGGDAIARTPVVPHETADQAMALSAVIDVSVTIVVPALGLVSEEAIAAFQAFFARKKR